MPAQSKEELEKLSKGALIALVQSLQEASDRLQQDIKYWKRLWDYSQSPQ